MMKLSSANFFQFGSLKFVVSERANRTIHRFHDPSKKCFMPLPNSDKILDSTKLKAFAHNKLNVNQTIEFIVERTKETFFFFRKGQNAGYKRFLLFPKCFQTDSFTSSLNLKLHFLPNAKMLDWSKLRVFTDDKINVTEKLKMVLGRIENIVGKGENAGYQHFLLFPRCFQKVFLIQGS